MFNLPNPNNRIKKQKRNQKVYLKIDIFVPLKKFLLKDFLFGSPRSLKIEL